CSKPLGKETEMTAIATAAPTLYRTREALIDYANNTARPGDRLRITYGDYDTARTVTATVSHTFAGPSVRTVLVDFAERPGRPPDIVSDVRNNRTDPSVRRVALHR